MNSKIVTFEKEKYEQLMKEYKSTEFKAHIELDDVMNKVTQEVGEIVEAKENGDIEEMYKEAGDALMNIISVSYELGISPDFEKKELLEVSISKLLIDLANWNTKVQGFRNRYSRQEETIESVTNATNELVGDILSFSSPDLSALQMIENNLTKFISRAGMYYKKIDLKDYIRSFPDFPKEGIDFKDISPLLENRDAMRNIVFEMAEKCRGADVIAGLDARGFLFGEAIANLLEKPFVMIRKVGKLPGETIGIKYGLEYGSDEIEIQVGAIKEGQKVSLVDDLLATGGTMKAATKLIEKAGGKVENIVFAISLDEEVLVEMPERKNLGEYGVESILKYN